jgi:alkaline phosphatase D
MGAYSPTRRGFLRDGAVLAGATALWGCAPPEEAEVFVPSELDRGRPPPPVSLPEAATFPLGVASGDVDSTTGQAVLWGKHTGAASLRLVVWLPAGGVVLDRAVTRADGGFLHAGIAGLTPGTAHHFAFVEMNGTRQVARSPIGTFRSPHAADASPDLDIAAFACTKQGRDFATLSRAVSRELDCVLMLGDTSYNENCSTVSQYRTKWAENLGTPAYKALRAHQAALVTWDDHEVANNWDPEKISPGQLAAATQTFFEHLPLRRLEQPNRIWRRSRFGTTLEVFVLDSKGERRSSRKEYLSREQLDWLESGLASSPCAFKMIMSSLPIGDFPWPWDFVKNLRWAGFPSQREEILRFIDERRIEGVMWLAGDFHLGSVGRVAEEGLGSSQWEILCGPGAQRGNPLVYTMNDTQWPFATATSNMTFFHLEPSTGRAVVQHVAGDGEMLNETTLFA